MTDTIPTTIPIKSPSKKDKSMIRSRNTLPIGKGMFVWNIEDKSTNTPQKLVNLLLAGKYQHVLLHIHDGSYNEKQVLGGMDLAPFIEALVDAEIQVWGWGAVYKDWWRQGVDRVVEALAKYPEMVGYVVDAEQPIKGAPAEAAMIMSRLRGALPDCPIGLSSYRYPHLHLDLPFDEFRAECDFDMPQIYWMQNFRADAGEVELALCYKEYQEFDKKLPFIPTGPAYKDAGWAPTPQQVERFMTGAKILGCEGVNFWVLYQAVRDVPSVFETINNFEYTGNTPPPPPPSTQRLWMKVTSNCYVRKTTSIFNNTPLRLRLVGEVVEVEEIAVNNALEVWVRDSEGWSAVVYLFKKYMDGESV